LCVLGDRSGLARRDGVPEHDVVLGEMKLADLAYLHSISIRPTNPVGTNLEAVAMGQHVPVGVGDLEVRGDLVVSQHVLRDLKLDLLVGTDHRAQGRQLVTGSTPS